MTTRWLGALVISFCVFFLYVSPVTCVPHGSSTTQSWGSLLHVPSIVETRIPGVAPFLFRIGIWDLLVHRGQKSYTPIAFGKLWTTTGVRCMKHASSLSMFETGPGIKPGTFGLADECSTTEQNLLCTLSYDVYMPSL